MKLTLIGGALALAAVAGCAELTDTTGVTPEQQACVAQTLVAMQADAAAKDLRLAQKAALVAQACGLSADAVLFKLAEAE